MRLDVAGFIESRPSIRAELRDVQNNPDTVVIEYLEPPDYGVSLRLFIIGAEAADKLSVLAHEAAALIRRRTNEVASIDPEWLTHDEAGLKPPANDPNEDRDTPMMWNGQNVGP